MSLNLSFITIAKRPPTYTVFATKNKGSWGVFVLFRFCFKNLRSSWQLFNQLLRVLHLKSAQKRCETLLFWLLLLKDDKKQSYRAESACQLCTLSQGTNH